MNYLFLAPGFEEIEAITVIDMMRRAGIPLATVSITEKTQVIGAHEIEVTADASIASIASILPNAESASILPGGQPGTDNLAASPQLTVLLLRQARDKALIAAICAAPSVLGGLGLLSGKRATCYPGFEERLAGAILVDSAVVEEENFITANGPGAAIAFSLAIITRLKGAACSEKIAKGMQVERT